MAKPFAGNILIPAAGQSRRMQGVDKLLQTVDGMPLLRRTAWNALTATDRVWVTLPPDAEERAKVLEGLDLNILQIDDAPTGMAASFRGYAAALSAAEGTLVLPADMPDIDAKDVQAIAAVAAKEPDTPARGCGPNEEPGHPVYFPPDLVARFSQLLGDEGARSLLTGQNTRLVPLPGTHALTDLDTPDAWRQWRAANPGRA